MTSLSTVRHLGDCLDVSQHVLSKVICGCSINIKQTEIVQHTHGKESSTIDQEQNYLYKKNFDVWTQVFLDNAGIACEPWR